MRKASDDLGLDQTLSIGRKKQWDLNGRNKYMNEVPFAFRLY